MTYLFFFSKLKRTQNQFKTGTGDKSVRSDITISVPFKSLVSSIKNLTYEEKVGLLEAIEEQLEQELMQRNPLIQQEIEEARSAYKIGDYVTLDEYKARNKERLL